MVKPTISVAQIRSADELPDVRRLFREYAEALGVDLSFQDFAAELDALPGKYAPPGGQILVARYDTGQPVGCVAMRPLDEPETCEMKRLYVRPAARGCDLGRRLAVAIIGCARDAGYARMRLDTLGSMTAAQALYSALGFRATEPYYDSPIPGTLFLALEL